MTDCESSNSKMDQVVSGFTLSADFSNPVIKRNYENVDDTNSLSIKKSRMTIENNSIVAIDVKPLAIVEADTPKLSRQFWKAGNDEESKPVLCYLDGKDAAVRVHPQFLHANATSHTWALGAFAELLDNSLDEVSNGATYVRIDSSTNKRDGKSSILIVEDNGGGMDPSRFRECLSLGYSRKRNMANKVGQYGNGFKTSTMRLGADAIVFSRSKGINGNNPTQSIGMLSYTFLYETRKCEAIVPTVGFELVDNNWKSIIYNSTEDQWLENLQTILKWSPFLSEQDLCDQFNSIEEQGTRIVIYNLWEDDEEKLELDFDTDPHDIQLRGVNRDEKNIEMAKAYPNSKHFLTYKHSLRSYASILYFTLPPTFKIILRDKDIEHHNLVDDMMMIEDIRYRPNRSPGKPEHDMMAFLKLGFVKDARHHIDIQGFNVYHKNRLIKPFWRVWNAAGSDGRGVIGILEANFIQPAHNKQGFERTQVLSKLEARLIQHQKSYWTSRCHEIGYAPRRKPRNHENSFTVFTRPSNNVNSAKGSFSTPAPAGCRQIVEPSGSNRNSEIDTRGSGVGIKPMNGNHGIGTSFRVTGSVILEAELQNVNQESARLVSELQKVKQESANVVSKLQGEKEQLELQLKQSKLMIKMLEKVKENEMNIFQDEKVHRDVTEEMFKKKLREAQDTIDELQKQVEILKGNRLQ